MVDTRPKPVACPPTQRLEATRMDIPSRPIESGLWNAAWSTEFVAWYWWNTQTDKTSWDAPDGVAHADFLNHIRLTKDCLCYLGHMANRDHSIALRSWCQRNTRVALIDKYKEPYEQLCSQIPALAPLLSYLKWGEDESEMAAAAVVQLITREKRLGAACPRPPGAVKRP
jgi:hypothetical protein